MIEIAQQTSRQLQALQTPNSIPSVHTSERFDDRTAEYDIGSGSASLIKVVRQLRLLALRFFRRQQRVEYTASFAGPDRTDQLFVLSRMSTSTVLVEWLEYSLCVY